MSDQENTVDFNKMFCRGSVGCRLNLEEKLVLGSAFQVPEKGLTYKDRQSFSHHY